MENKNGAARKDIYCFSGLILSINSIIQLWKDLKSEEILFLLTNRLNQDPLENLFSSIRRHGGHSTNPTVKLFRIALQRSITSGLQDQVENSNCEIDDNKYICVDLDDKSENKNNTDENIGSNMHMEILTSSSDESSDINSSIKSLNFETGTMSSNSIVYFGGFLVKRCIEKFKCQTCNKRLHTTKNMSDPDQMLIINRDYSSTDHINYLKIPTRDVRQVINLCCEIFSTEFQNYIYKIGIKKYVFL